MFIRRAQLWLNSKLRLKIPLRSKLWKKNNKIVFISHDIKLLFKKLKTLVFVTKKVETKTTN